MSRSLGYREQRTASWGRDLRTRLDPASGVMHCADWLSTSFPAQETRTVSSSHSAPIMLLHYLPDLIVVSWRRSTPLACHADSC
jgi:hypothetical protein